MVVVSSDLFSVRGGRRLPLTASGRRPARDGGQTLGPRSLAPSLSLSPLARSCFAPFGDTLGTLTSDLSTHSRRRRHSPISRLARSLAWSSVMPDAYQDSLPPPPANSDEPFSLPLPHPDPSAKPVPPKQLSPDEQDKLHRIVNHFNDPAFKLPNSLKVLKARWTKEGQGQGSRFGGLFGRSATPSQDEVRRTTLPRTTTSAPAFRPILRSQPDLVPLRSADERPAPAQRRRKVLLVAPGLPALLPRRQVGLRGRAAPRRRDGRLAPRVRRRGHEGGGRLGRGRDGQGARLWLRRQCAPCPLHGASRISCVLDLPLDRTMRTCGEDHVGRN